MSRQVFRTPVFKYSGVWQVSSGVLSGVSNTCSRIFKCPVRCSEHLFSNIHRCLAGVVRCPVRSFEHLFSNMQVSRQVSCQVFRAPVLEYAGVPSGVLSGVSNTRFRIFKCLAGVVRRRVKCFEHLFSNIQVSRMPVFEYSGVWQVPSREFIILLMDSAPDT